MTEPPTGPLTTFEVEVWGGAIERRYRRLRPDVEELPWDSFDARLYDEAALVPARAAWTRAAFQEHRTAAACAEALRLLIDAQAPLDLIGLAARFPLDEVAHIEMCARMATLAGGGTELRYRPEELIRVPPQDLPPLLRAADLVVRVFCVGEAVSIPLLRATWHAARHPLPKAILGRIVRDEAAHGTFGLAFLDWAAPRLSARDRAFLGEAADGAIRAVHEQWRFLERAPPPTDLEAHPLGWMQSSDYFAVAERAMQQQVLAPLVARGIQPTAIGEWHAPATLYP